MLLYPFEKKLHLPAVFVKVCDGHSCHIEVVGKEIECLLDFLVSVFDSPERLWIVCGRFHASTKNAIHLAKRFVDSRVTARIQEDIERNIDIQQTGATRSRRLWRHIRSHMSFRGERDEFENDTVDSDDALPPSHLPTS